jgi:hypothetical protein
MKKEESKFTHPLPRSWLRPYILGLDNMFHGRWDYWIRTLEAGKPLDEPIPRIDFSTPNKEATRNITDCINIIQRKGHGAHEAWCAFVDWLLWGFGSNLVTEFPPRINEDANWNLYTTFNLGLMIKDPADYTAWGSCEFARMKAGGYFPTPMHICTMMADMQMTESNKTKTTCDCCVGTGSMLLAASNYSLRLYGQDINLNMVKMCHVNGFLYVPWMVAPGDGFIDWNTRDDYLIAITAYKEWKNKTEAPTILITHKPKTNTLQDWV